MIREESNALLMLNNLILKNMKHIISLLMVVLISTVMANAKTVRGYVADKDGKPVAGMKMVVVNTENPQKKSIAVTDDKGFFSMLVPDDLDTSDLVNVFAGNGTKVVQYRETSTGIRLVVEPSRKTESVLAQK